MDILEKKEYNIIKIKKIISKTEKSDEDMIFLYKEFENYEYFQSLFKFHGLTTMKKVIQHMCLKEVPRGLYIYKNGEHCSKVYVILEGKVLISNKRKENDDIISEESNDKEEMLLSIGQVLGEKSVLENLKR